MDGGMDGGTDGGMQGRMEGGMEGPDSIRKKLSRYFTFEGKAVRKAGSSRMRVENRTRQTVLADQLEVASHGETRRKGLLGRSGLSSGSGLWIKPCESVHTFGMQFAIDLVYLDRSYRVKKLRRDVGPWRISACLTAHSVLELPSGTIEATGSRKGDWLEIRAADSAGL